MVKRRGEKQGLIWITYGALLLSFAALLRLSAFVSETGHATTGAEIVVAGVAISFASYALARITHR